MKKNIIRKAFGASIITSLLFSVGTTTLAQQEPEGLTISPFLFERQMEKGETLNEQVEIINNNPFRTKIDPLVMDFLPSGDNGQPVFYEAGTGDPTYSLASWITLEDTKSFELAPKEHKTIKFTIAPPSNAENGGHYGTVLFNFKAVNPTGTAVEISQRIGANILVKLGKANEDGFISSFKTQRWFYNFPPVTFLTTFKNTGNVHTKPRGKITIWNTFGRKVAVLRINENANNTLPGSGRAYASTWEDKYGFGRYTAEAEVTFGQNGTLITAHTSFWVIPWKITVAVIIGLFLLGLFLTIGTKRYNRWVIRQAQQVSPPVRTVRRRPAAKPKPKTKKTP